MAAAALIAALVAVWLQLTAGLPPVEDELSSPMQQPLRIYTGDGHLIGIFGEQRNSPVDYEHMPRRLVQAFLAAEDDQFFQHAGVDAAGIMRAMWTLITTGEARQGGSTITMQLARGVYLSRTKTFLRKLREIALAFRIERRFSKQKILETYLNRVYLGERAYGVGAAAQTYFGKHLSELSLAEAALLAGLPKAPSTDNPIANPERAKRRRTYVLKRMRALSQISESEYVAALRAALPGSAPGSEVNSGAEYVAEMVRLAMVDRLGDRAYQDGYDVYTTVLWQHQAAATEAVRSALRNYGERHPFSKDRDLETVQGALVSIDPGTGAIRALMGGEDFAKSEYNRATHARRQAGSSMKPFVYAAALAAGYTPASILLDEPVVVERPGVPVAWRPRNFSREAAGPVRLRDALVHSRNLASIRLLQSIGVDSARRFVQRFGFTAERLPDSPTLALGSGSFTPLEMARAYAVFANGGFLVDPYVIQEIRDRAGTVLFRSPRRAVCRDCGNPEAVGPPATMASIGDVGTRVLPARIAYLMRDMLRDVATYGTAARVRDLGRNDLAGKTGTTNDAKDAWFIGFQSGNTTACWVGFDRPRSLGRGETGARAALPMWLHFMKKTLAAQPEDWPQAPAGIVYARIDPQTGLPSSAAEPMAIWEQFRRENVPRNMPLSTNSIELF